MRATYSSRWDRGFSLSRSWLARFLDTACSVYLFNVFPTKADGQQPGAASVGEEAEVADAYEATREQMQQKAPQELINDQRHQFLLVAMSRIAPAEGDVTIFQSNESVVNAMGVSA